MASVIPPAPLDTDVAADRFDTGGATGLRPGVAERRFRFELAAHPSSVARARHLTRARLNGWVVGEDTCDTAALVVSELVTNAIVHAAGAFVVCELHAEDDLVRIAVRDEGCTPGEPHPAEQRPEEEHGRGLLLVAALCRAWGSQKAGPGLLVWAELARETEPRATGEASLPAQLSRDLSCSGDRSRAAEDTAIRSDLGWSAKKPPAGGEDRSGLGWSTEIPPSDGRDCGAADSWKTETAWV